MYPPWFIRMRLGSVAWVTSLFNSKSTLQEGISRGKGIFFSQMMWGWDAPKAIYPIFEMAFSLLTAICYWFHAVLGGPPSQALPYLFEKRFIANRQWIWQGCSDIFQALFSFGVLALQSYFPTLVLHFMPWEGDRYQTLHEKVVLKLNPPSFTHFGLAKWPNTY